jgi:putative ABC transport system permease protein
MIALETLRTHKLRSFLTLLGVILSVSTLIVVVALVAGSNKYIADKVANFGANVFLVAQYPIVTSHEQFVKLQRTNKTVTWEDYEFVRDEMSLAKNVGFREARLVKSKYQTKDLEDVRLLGVTANMGEIGLQEPEFGRYITDSDNDHRADVTMIGHELAKRLFEGTDPLGKAVFLDGKPYEVVGVAKELGTTFGQSQDAFAVVPVMTYRKSYGTQEGGSIQVQAIKQEWMQAAEDEARQLMRAHRHIKPQDEDNFGLIEPSSVMSLWENLTGTLAKSSVGIVSIFLIIGGIVIMNIMLASVTERTREIGIRRAIGATRRQIVYQFLIETVVLSTVGGLIGIGIGALIPLLITQFSGMPTVIRLEGVLVPLFISMAIGILFGLYPAMNAARVDPIVALRHE